MRLCTKCDGETFILVQAQSMPAPCVRTSCVPGLVSTCPRCHGTGFDPEDCRTCKWWTEDVDDTHFCDHNSVPICFDHGLGTDIQYGCIYHEIDKDKH